MISRLLDLIEPFDHRRALQLLSHAARTRRLRVAAPVRHSFVVLLDVIDDRA